MAEPDRFTEETPPSRTVFVRAPASFGVDTGNIRLGVWLVEPGDEVHEGTVLAELIAPGLLLELCSPCEGKVRELRQATSETPIESDTVLCELTTR